MSLMFQRPFTFSGSDFYPYKIDQSCRFNDDDSALLYRTPAGDPDDGKKWSFSFWIKRCNLGIVQIILGAGTNDTNRTIIYFDTNNKLVFYSYYSAATKASISCDMLFRDVISWYHVLVTLDALNSQLIFYVNNEEMSQTVGTGVHNSNHHINAATTNAISRTAYAATNYGDYYLAEVQMIDGLELTPSSFGKSKYGIWIPKRYTGSYGTNGFKLDFADSSDLGNDVSGNGNDFTSSGLASNDQVEDSPTNNYPTLNNLHELSTATLSNGNLQCTGVENEYATIIIPSTRKWGWEITVSENGSFGLEDIDLNEKVAADVSGEVVEMLVDMDAGTLKKKVDGGALETIETTLNTTSEWYPHFKAACSVDFGQLGYLPSETGYKALCSNNLSTPKVKNSSTGFDVITYEGNATVRDITDLNFDISTGGLVWIKNRDAADEHKLIDTVRGATKELSSDSNVVEGTDVNGLTAFLTNGFSLGTGAAGYNDNNESFVAWCFRMGSKYGFDIQTYTGTGVAHAENHNLSGVPELIMVKNLDVAARNWPTYHYHALNKTDPETDCGFLDLTNAWADNVNRWNDTAPTSTQFTVGTSIYVNENTKSHVAYLWRSIEGFSKVFSYTGNANANGPFVYCGFRPAYLLIKNAEYNPASWVMFDVKRDTYNVVNHWLIADGVNVETVTAGIDIDILSNGFKIRGTNTNINANGNVIVGITYAEQPGKWSVAR